MSVNPSFDERLVFIGAGGNGDVIDLSVGIDRGEREREEYNCEWRTAAALHGLPPVYAKWDCDFEHANRIAERGLAQEPSHGVSQPRGHEGTLPVFLRRPSCPSWLMVFCALRRLK